MFWFFCFIGVLSQTYYARGELKTCKSNQIPKKIPNMILFFFTTGQITPERDFVITWKDDFQKYLKNSPYYTDADVADSKYYQRYYLESTVSRG